MKGLLFEAIALAMIASSCADPIHSAEVSALGGEASGVRPGPTHRPGQPCLTCHGGSGPGSPTFAVAGTVFQVKGATTPAVSAIVHLVDGTGRKFDATTNSAGNFYVEETTWVPNYPMDVSVGYGSLTATMLTHVGRDGACASCHYGPPGPSTPGPVYLAESADDLAGITP